MTELLAESTSDEARNIFRALVATGPKFLRLQNTPMDMRAVIVQVAHLAVDAQRAGLGFSKYLTTAPFGIDPEVLRLARNIAETIRSSKGTVAIFDELADDGFEVVSQIADEQEGLLGASDGADATDIWGNAQVNSQSAVLQNFNDKIELRRNSTDILRQTKEQSDTIKPSGGKRYANPDAEEHARFAERLRNQESRDFRQEFGRQHGQYRAAAVGRASARNVQRLDGRGRKTRGGARVLARWEAPAELKNLYGLNGMATPAILELAHSPESAEVFRNAILAARRSNPFAASVYAYEVADYQNMSLFLTEDETAGIAVKPNGDIVSVFNTAGGPHKGVSHMLLEVAVANGGRKLDCFDTVLPKIYGAHGFRAISRQRWDEQYAPDGWDKKLFGKYNHGEPDVTYMVYDPTYYGDYKRTDGVLADSYKDAVDMQDEAKDELTGTSSDELFQTEGERRIKSIADIKLEAETKAWSKVLDELKTMPSKQVKMLTQTPLVMSMVGAKFRELYAVPHFFERMFDPKSGLSKDTYKQIPKALADPMAIFRQPNGRFLFLLDLKDDFGGSVVVPVEFEAKKDFGKVNLAVSAHGKSGAGKPKYGWIKNRLNDRVYVNRQKIGSQNTSSGASSLWVLSESLGNNVLTEADLVKRRSQENNTLYQGNDQTRGGYSQSLNQIHLTDNADLSTFAHEMSHWYLTNLFDLARNNPSSVLQDDVRAILTDWGLIKKEDQNDIGNVLSEKWDSLGFEGQRKYQERFAYQTEIYLATGKVPSGKLQTAFRNLGRWIRDVYRVWVGGVEQQRSEQYKSEFGEELPKLSDEVRRVMDRMLWSDEAIRRAEQIEGIRPLFDTKPDNMSEEEWEKQQKERFDALDEGANELLKAQAKDERWYVNARSKLLKEIQQNALEVREKERRKIAEKVFSSKEYKALDAIKNSAKKGVGDWRMDPKQLEASGFNEYAISRLKKAGLIREGGTSPAQVVDMLGVIAKFENAQELIKGLLKVSDVKALIQRETTRVCLRKHSGLFKPKEIDASITKALQNDARARLVNTELRYLMNDKTLSDIVIRQTAKKAAEALINKTTIGKLRPRGLLAGQRRAARKSYEALMQGNKQLAAVYKRQQLVYMEASLIALDLQRQIDRVNNLKKIIFRSDKKLSKTYDVDLINVCRYILTNEGMGKVAAADYDPTTAEKFVENLAKYDEIRYTNLKPLLDKHCFDNRKFYDTTVARFRSTLEDVESVYAMAREAKQVTVEQKKVSVEEIVNTLLSQANALKGREPSTAGQSHTITAQERVSRKILAGFNLLKRAESWCNQMDVGNPNHPFRTFIYDPIAAAAARYRNTNAEFQGRLVDLLKPMIKDWKSKTNIEASEIKYTFDTKAELIAALLHTGNESNKRKLLLGGRGKDKAWATEEVDSDGEKHLNTSAWDGFVARCMANGTITKKDMDFVQAVWDLLEETKAQTQKAYKAMYGRYFKEVEASPVVTPFGVYRGGYVPAKVDQSLVPDAGEKNEANRIIENDFNFTMPVNDPGFAQSRVENYTKPLLLDIGSLCNHVDSVLRFAYLASACTDVAKVITDHEFRDYLDSYDASLVKDFLMPWVNRAYSQQIGDGKSDYVSRMANQLRSLAGINIMFGHVVNALQQVTGFSIAAQKVKPIYLLRAFKYLTSCRSTVADISALSDFMKSRFVDRSIEYVSKVKEYATISDASLKQKGAINKLYAIDRKLDPLRTWLMRNGYFVQTAMQTPIDAVVWMGAYQQAIDQGRTEQQAVMDADSVIRTTQSDFSPENISQIETGSALWRFFLVFYNYFNMQLNMLFEAGAQARQEKSLVKRYGIYTKAAVLTVIIPSAVAELIMQSLFNDLDTGDDDDLDALDLARIITSATAKDLLATAPIVGNIAQTGLAHLAKDKKTGAFSTVAQWMVGTDPYAGRILESPGIGLIKSSGNALKDAIEIANGEEVKAREAVRNFLDFASVMTRLPLGALKKPLGYGAGVLADEIHPEDELEAVAGFISGREKRKK